MAWPVSEFEAVAREDCRAEVDRLVAAVMGAPVTAPQDPRLFLDIARLNRLLMHPDLPPLGGALQDELDHFRARSKRGIVQHLTAARDISESLTKAGIVHFHFKGPLLQYRIHGSALRKHSYDIDLLVHPDQRREAGQVLTEAGYVATEEELGSWWTTFLSERHFVHPEHGTVIDLHHGLQQAGLPRPRNIADFLARRETLAYFGTEFSVPSTPDMCLISAITVLKAFMAQDPAGAAVFDLHRLSRSLSSEDRARLRGYARESGLTETLDFALVLAQVAFEQPLTHTLPDWMPPPEALRAMLWQPWRADLHFPRRRHVLAWLCSYRPDRMAREMSRAALSDSYRVFLGWWQNRQDSTRQVLS